MASGKSDVTGPAPGAGGNERRVALGCLAGAIAAAVVALISLGGAVWWWLDANAYTDRFAGDPEPPRLFRMPVPDPPRELAFVGEDGFGPDGYSTRSVDGVAVLAAVHAWRFDLLERWTSEVAAAAEEDFHKEYWILDLASAFSVDDPRVGRALDAWVARAPSSFAARLARGEHLLAVAYGLRGNAYVRWTSESRLAAMSEAVGRALVELDRARALRPTSVAPEPPSMVAAALVGDEARLRAAYVRATTVCALCVGPRKEMIRHRRPRWGGTVEEMRALAAEAAGLASRNPRLAALAGLVDWERGETLVGRRRYAEAIAAYDRALTAGDIEDYYLGRADARLRAGDAAAAAADFDRAAALRPGQREHDANVLALLRARRADEVGPLFVRYALLSPTSERLAVLAGDVSRVVAFAAWQHARAQRFEQALPLLDLALQIDPDNADARERLAYCGRQHAQRLQGRLPEIEARMARDPDDFEAVRAFDYTAMAAGVPPARVVEAWTRWLERHPRDTQAMIERSGTNLALGDTAASRRDAGRACRLGNRMGCVRLAQVPGAPPP